MKKLGYVMLIAGFLAAAWVAMQQDIAVNWLLFLPVAAVGVAAVVILRRLRKVEAEHADTVAANIGEMNRSIDRLVESVSRLAADKTVGVYDVRLRIEETIRADLNAFAEARDTITVKYGLQSFAHVMTTFAAGERYLNRVWSASADGYADEVRDYLGRAAEQFSETRDRFRALSAGKAA